MKQEDRTHNVLLVGPGLNWSAAERSALKDALALREQGHNPLLYVVKDSVLAYHASIHNIPCAYHLVAESYSPFNWGRFLSLGGVIRRYEINVVHVYLSESLNVLWPIAHIMRSWPLIPLVVTRFNSSPKIYRGPLYGALAKRVDLLLTSSKDLARELSLSLRLPPHKIDEQGLAVTGQRTSKEQKLKNSIALCLSGPEIDPQSLSTVFVAFATLIEYYQEGLPAHLTLALLAPKRWEHNILYRPLQKMAQDLKIIDRIEFLEGEGPGSIDPPWVWLVLDENNEGKKDDLDVVEDYGMEALLRGIPICLARRGPSMELLRQYPFIGLHYRPGDNRDLVAKLNLIMTHRAHYAMAIEDSYQSLSARFSQDFFKDRLLNYYRRLISKRENFHYRKSKK